MTNATRSWPVVLTAILLGALSVASRASEPIPSDTPIRADAAAASSNADPRDHPIAPTYHPPTPAVIDGIADILETSDDRREGAHRALRELTARWTDRPPHDPSSAVMEVASGRLDVLHFEHDDGYRRAARPDAAECTCPTLPRSPRGLDNDLVTALQALSFHFSAPLREGDDRPRPSRRSRIAFHLLLEHIDVHATPANINIIRWDDLPSTVEVLLIIKQVLGHIPDRARDAILNDRRVGPPPALQFLMMRTSGLRGWPIDASHVEAAGGFPECPAGRTDWYATLTTVVDQHEQARTNAIAWYRFIAPDLDEEQRSLLRTAIFARVIPSAPETADLLRVDAVLRAALASASSDDREQALGASLLTDWEHAIDEHLEVSMRTIQHIFVLDALGRPYGTPQAVVERREDVFVPFETWHAWDVLTTTARRTIQRLD